MRNEIIYIILGMALVTYATRFGSLIWLRFTGIPAWLESWLKHIPTAILTALIAPMLLLPEGYLNISLKNHYLLAGVVAAVAAYKSRNIILTMFLGLGVMLFLRSIG